MAQAVVISMMTGDQWLIKKAFMNHEPVVPLSVAHDPSVAHQKVLILGH